MKYANKLHITTIVILAGILLCPINISQAASRSISIAGSQSSWLDTGFVFDGKTSYRISATGMINYCSGAPQCNATPDGSREFHCGGGPTDAGGPCGSLIVRIGGVNGTKMVVGSGFTFPKSTKGRLEIGIQDFLFEDNSGQFNVKITSLTKERFDISGYVLGSNGAPFRGETIIATSKGKTGRARTNREGRYQFRNLLEGKYRLSLAGNYFFPITFIALDDSAGNQAFEPRRHIINLNQDMINQNFIARRFSTIKAAFRRPPRKTPTDRLCQLNPPIASGLIAQADLAKGTRLRLTDSIFAGGTVVTVREDGPYESAKFVLARLMCSGIQSTTAGIGLPLNTGGILEGEQAIVEAAPSRR
ncbi:MAG TPA: carboxypeptidase regulatory-like domain-containing protein [Oligoflexia bacterium]|nr:carboxypeptidase regulatory-like domain-containing protein [Oligoflexia bacterium]HMP27698.1 carboxypeptidase regulatory-like domain-containing protein [Oligoflexia bacterium]